MNTTELTVTMDVIWIIVAAALVMFMQAGFTALESGLTRAKNSINVAMKNLTDFVVAVLVFWCCGYGLMFGQSYHGFFGSSLMGLEGMTDAKDYAVFAFQVTFAATAATIVSGAVAERMRFAAYVLVSLILIAFVYPISGHWIWSADGWLAQKGFVDFAGSTVVHSLGGWVGLAGAWLLGARTGRFDEQGQPRTIHGQNLVLAVMGVLILWFGWIGFNAGSTLGADKAAALIVVNTLLAAAAGGAGCFLTSLLVNNGQVSIEKMLNGVVGGLVSVTAGCAVLEPGGALVLGLIGGVIVYCAEEFVLHGLKIDDPVNVIAAHGIGGAWGTLGLALLAPAANLPMGSAWAQFQVQLLGVSAVFAWGFGFGIVIFFLLRQFGFLRVTPEAEEQGLNAHEHGASTGLLDTMKAMDQIVKAYNQSRVSALGTTSEPAKGGDLTRRIQVEYGAEGYEIAGLFNQLMDYFHDTIFELKHGMEQLSKASRLLSQSSQEMQVDANQQHICSEQLNQSVSQFSHAMDTITDHTKNASQATQQADQHTKAGAATVEQTIVSVEDLTRQVMSAFDTIQELTQRMSAIEKFVDTIAGIAEQTNLLALNAAIEAARAGDVGRGFAVVADEVRLLSQHSSDATVNIKDLIAQLRTSADQAQIVMQHTRSSAEQTVQQIGESQSAVTSISDQVQYIAELSAQVASATATQSEVIDDVGVQINNFLTSVANSKTRAQALSVTSEDLQQLAKHLQQLVYGLKVADQCTNLIHAPTRAD